MSRNWWIGPVAVVFAASVPVASASAETSCIACHGDPDLFEAEALEIVRSFGGDVHAEVGLSCHDCHGGNPDPALAEDMDAAMDSAYGPSPYRGVPKRKANPSFCGSCHSDPSYMKRFRPDARVDQEREYWTSQHGQALERGDNEVATCIDCHGTHLINRSSNPESSVYPTQVAETCRRCHADGGKMAGYFLSDNSPLPIDQYARWRQSIHAIAMFEKEDLTAPTCNDCHGNHGATPPGLESVTFVCGQCHGREAELFRGSPKHAGYKAHNEYLVDAGTEGCALCHEAPQAQLTGIRSFGECTSCHGNHGIIRPTVAMFSALPETPCEFCHQEGGLLTADQQESKTARKGYLAARDGLLTDAKSIGLEGEDLFNWLVGTTMTLPAHTVVGDVNPDGTPKPRPEFDRLFSKFRIGRTYFTYQDPSSGETVRAPIVRCSTCHASGLLVGEDTPGARTGVELVERMQELTEETARAERILLAARRGGVETRESLLHIDQAVDAQISLEVLAHTFSAAEGTLFLEQYQQGLEHAHSAVAAGRSALDELAYRRTWLAVTLVVIVFGLVALALRIRDLSAHEQQQVST